LEKAARSAEESAQNGDAQLSTDGQAEKKERRFEGKIERVRPAVA